MEGLLSTGLPSLVLCFEYLALENLVSDKCLSAKLSNDIIWHPEIGMTSFQMSSFCGGLWTT